ncbi:MAG: hypothetical protein FWE82_03080 [Defluviitaleaceae bacterium]|nr:hypothetical protein [Defluviitaleaceae bacterium]
MLEKKMFANPAATYRPTPFWGLNGTLETAELERQITEFHKRGYGGVYLHPRGGMETDYLSDEYFDALRVCVKKCEELGILAWLYDEDWCPSGKAGNKTLVHDAGFAQKYILLNENAPDGYEVVTASDPDGRFRHINVDVCDKEVIDYFIEITHEQYKNHFKDYFGNVVPAIFTDEPHFALHEKKARPWSKNFEDKFLEKYGYSIKPLINDLFSDTETSPRTRFHYWNLLSEMFVAAFSKNIYDWCETNGIFYTGHFWEHVFPRPTHHGSVMPHYMNMHYPGIDMLFVSSPENPEQYGNDFIVKEASSVANQFGRDRVLTETNGASGWALNFAYQKRVIDWQLALGINLFCLHLSLYDMTGYRKRDFPLSYLDHQPWWDEFNILSDYIGRMSYAVTRGKYEADVLVLHPASSTWAAYGGAGAEKGLNEIAASVNGTVKRLGQNRIMYDIGDDVIMAAHAKIENGLMHVGEMAYKTVVVTESSIMRSEVFALLQKFADTGGQIFCTGVTPHLIDGEPSEKLSSFFMRDDIHHVSEAHLHAALRESGVKRVDVFEINGKKTDDIYAHVRRDKNQTVTFLCNLNMEHNSSLFVYVDASCEIVRWDAETGEVSGGPVPVHFDGKRHFILLTLNALESALLLADENKPVSVSEVADIKFLTEWTVSLNDQNAFHLQFCKISVDGGKFSKPDDVLKLDDELKDSMGVDRGAIFTLEPWMYTEEEKNICRSVVLEFPFTIDEIPEGKIFAAAELPQHFKISVNGSLAEADGGFYKDRAFQTYDITSHVRAGENILRVEAEKFNVMLNLESVYIVGNFALRRGKNGFSVVKPAKLFAGGVEGQGYPYYSGKISYTANFESEKPEGRASFTLGRYDGATTALYVNGNHVKTVGWPSGPFDIGKYIVQGKNEIKVVISNTLQNLLGPYGKQASQHLVHPGSFYIYNGRHEVFAPSGFDGFACVIG